MEYPKATLVLEDGTVYEGIGFGYHGVAVGEVVFNTGMTGYQEVLTDPSYAGQIVVMTYPLIGNYGINVEDLESERVQVAGFVVREFCEKPSHFRAQKTLREFLSDHRVPAIAEVDTRSLVRKLRVYGVMMGALGINRDSDELFELLRRSPRYDEMDFVQLVTTSQFHLWDGGLKPLERVLPKSEQLRIVVLDLGAKFSILRSLQRRGCEVIVAPAKASVQDILAWEPDGVLLSNGPGDPALLHYIIHTVWELLGKVPLFGICLGHQILGRALGGRTFKLKFGHHGSNHPVKDLRTGRVYITTQNHGYAVDEKTLEKTGAVVTHINLNDFTVEGLAHPELNIFSVQYHPEAAPGPFDNGYILDEFVQIMKQHRE